MSATASPQNRPMTPDVPLADTEPPASRGPSTARPTRRVQALNFVAFQAAWFAAVLGAAHQQPGWGTLAVVAAIAWHLTVCARPWDEFKLVAAVSALGLLLETLSVWQGQVVFAAGQPWPFAPAYWMVAMWSLLAIALNVTMRWLKRRWWLAAVLGAVVGPLSYASGVRLGAAHFVDPVLALSSLGLVWALAMPAVMWLSDRFDGVLVPQVPHG
jgi:hypothetical protein